MTSEPEPADDLAEVLESIRAESELPALAAAAVSADGVEELAAVGVRKLGDDAEVRTGDRFHLGSCTKTMTAALVATFVDEGELAWDTPLPELLPGAAESMHAAFREVTLADLLGHRGGFGEVTDYPVLWRELWESEDSLVDQRRRFAAEVLSREPVGEPRASFAYSNVHFIVAGAALEARTGTEWEGLLQARIFDRLGMASCGFGPAGSEDALDEPWGHNALRLPVAPGPEADNPPALGPAGTVHCALEDWARFVAVFLDDDQDLVSSESLERMTNPPDGEIAALGWLVIEPPWMDGEKVLFHNGSNTFNYAAVVVSPDRKRAALAATNWGRLATADAALAEVFAHLMGADRSE